MNDRTLQRPELRACEEVDLHHADKLVYKVSNKNTFQENIFVKSQAPFT